MEIPHRESCIGDIKHEVMKSIYLSFGFRQYLPESGRVFSDLLAKSGHWRLLNKRRRRRKRIYPRKTGREPDQTRKARVLTDSYSA